MRSGAYVAAGIQVAGRKPAALTRPAGEPMALHLRPSVLLSAADEDDRAIYFTGLALEGFSVMCGAFEAGLTAAVRQLLPDLVVIVLERGDDSDWDRVEHLLHDEATQQVPVIIVTAAVRPDEANRRKARDLDNCAAFISKPCDHNMLAAVLRRVAAGERGIEEIDKFGLR
jgi:CheY-like chemotaxis protein